MTPATVNIGFGEHNPEYGEEESEEHKERPEAVFFLDPAKYKEQNRADDDRNRDGYENVFRCIVPWQLSIQQNKNLFNSAMPLYNENFTAFTFSEEARQLLPKLPPMTTIFGDYKSMVASNVFLYQKINNVNTQYPLILFNERNGVKTGVICGTGIWQWKLYNYLYTQSHREFDEIINKIATYLYVPMRAMGYEL